MYVCVYIYMHAVELKSGPIFAFFSVKNWSIFCVFFENLILPAKRRGFFQEEKRNTKNDPFVALKTGPILLRNILGPVLNASLDQS